MDWASLASDFYWDGSLRDIYILGTSIEDWQTVLDVVRGFDPPPQFMVDGEVAQLPGHAIEVFAKRQEVSMLMRINISGIVVNCHFFAEDEIEFDIDPRDVSDAPRFESLVGFMKLLAASTQKTTVLTHENTPAAISVQTSTRPVRIIRKCVLISSAIVLA